jgi:hypothetical protein
MFMWTLAIPTPTSSRFDLSKNGNAVPVMDELATVSLNLWAQEHNYKKAQPCLGFSYQVLGNITYRMAVIVVSFQTSKILRPGISPPR